MGTKSVIAIELLAMEFKASCEPGVAGQARRTLVQYDGKRMTESWNSLAAKQLLALAEFLSR